MCALIGLGRWAIVLNHCFDVPIDVDNDEWPSTFGSHRLVSRCQTDAPVLAPNGPRRHVIDKDELMVYNSDQAAHSGARPGQPAGALPP
jgi:hypothetical protein